MTPVLFDVAGRVVIVTGGGRAFGRVYSEQFAAAGMRVVLAVRTDISIPEETRAMAEAAAREFGGIEHRWRESDLLLWDNRCTLHARRDFNAEESRWLRRVTIKGDTPR